METRFLKSYLKEKSLVISLGPYLLYLYSHVTLFLVYFEVCLFSNLYTQSGLKIMTPRLRVACSSGWASPVPP